MLRNHQLAFDIDFLPAYSRDDFLICLENSHIVKMLENTDLWHSHCLILCGGKSSGKTHLAHIFASKYNKRAAFIDSGDLTNEIVPELVKDNDCVIVERADENPNDEALFHLFNYTKENGLKLLLTAVKPLGAWRATLPDLTSRLGTAPVMTIPAPSDALISALFLKLFSDKQIDITSEALSYLVARADRSFQGIKQLVDKADKLSLQEKRKVTIPLLKQALEDIE